MADAALRPRPEALTAGIEHFWRVETDPLRLITYRLADGGYRETGMWSLGETASITDPFAVEVEISGLRPD